MPESAFGTPAGAAAQRTPSSGAPPLGWMDTLQSLWQELPGLLSDRVELLSLELQRAGRALALIVAWVIAAAILGGTAWLLLWSAIVIGLVALGLPLTGALAAALLINGLGLLLVARQLRQLLPQLRLPATRRHLMFSTPSGPAGADNPGSPHENPSPTAAQPRTPA